MFIADEFERIVDESCGNHVSLKVMDVSGHFLSAVEGENQLLTTNNLGSPGTLSFDC
jgi:hypothetical protein